MWKSCYLKHAYQLKKLEYIILGYQIFMQSFTVWGIVLINKEKELIV